MQCSEPRIAWIGIFGTHFDGAMHATASIGDQAGSPAAGSILIKTWKSTDGDATLIAATTFSMKVNWIAFGT